MEQWLDLSTGINPFAWPLPAIPASLWHDLPQQDGALLQTAKACYQCTSLLPVAGSQAAIAWLPRLRHDLAGRARVGILSPGFSEHAKSWQQAGHEVVPLVAGDIDATLSSLDILVIINPNNPTAQTFDRSQLLDWHGQLASRGGWLIVDEAFMDATPQGSLASHGERSGLILLRSLGKFWGLAGARIGFVVAEARLLDDLQKIMGPWTVSGPAAFVAQQALADTDWQDAMRRKLAMASQRLVDLLSHYGLAVQGRTPLFAWLPHADCLELFEALASLGILIRVFPAAPDRCGSLRFGLPGGEEDWQRLASALSVIMT